MKTFIILITTFLFTSIGVDSELENSDCPAGQISYTLSCTTVCSNPPSPWTITAVFAKTAELEKDNCETPNTDLSLNSN